MVSPFSRLKVLHGKLDFTDWNFIGELEKIINKKIAETLQQDLIDNPPKIEFYLIKGKIQLRVEDLFGESNIELAIAMDDAFEGLIKFGGLGEEAEEALVVAKELRRYADVLEKKANSL